jgi:hypothetical protein
MANNTVLLSHKPRWVVIASHLWDNWRARRQAGAGVLEMTAASCHGWSVNKSLKYAQQVYSDYKRYGGFSAADLKDKTVLELGPGDNLAVALRFVAAGASKVVCLDKFFWNRDRTRERSLYLALRESLNRDEKRRFDTAVELGGGITFNPERLQYTHGTGIESADRVLGAAAFDFIVSRAVLMEVHLLEGAFAAMDRLLRPSGVMVHKIAPLHDYGMFSDNGHHPLEFLTIPDPIYSAMSEQSGKPNRRLAGYYCQKAREMGHSVQLHVTRTLETARASVPDLPPGTTKPQYGVHYSARTFQLIRDIRPRLIKRYSDVPDEDLIVADGFLVARKPPSATQGKELR